MGILIFLISTLAFCWAFGFQIDNGIPIVLFWLKVFGSWQGGSKSLVVGKEMVGGWHVEG
jgi:hypothetical protein